MRNRINNLVTDPILQWLGSYKLLSSVHGVCILNSENQKEFKLRGTNVKVLYSYDSRTDLEFAEYASRIYMKKLKPTGIISSIVWILI